MPEIAMQFMNKKTRNYGGFFYHFIGKQRLNGLRLNVKISIRLQDHVRSVMSLEMIRSKLNDLVKTVLH